MQADAKPFAYNKTLSEGICYENQHINWLKALRYSKNITWETG